MSHLNHKPTKEEVSKSADKQLQDRLDEECLVPLLRRDVIVIHNILASMSYKLGDAEVIIHKILPRLTPYAAVDTNITKESEKEQIALGKKN